DPRHRVLHLSLHDALPISCSCVSGSVTSFSLIGSKRALLHQIKTGKQKDPNQVDEVPVQADHFDAIGVPLPLRGPHLVAEEEERSEEHTSELQSLAYLVCR